MPESVRGGADNSEILTTYSGTVPGDAMDAVTGKVDVKRMAGAVGILTSGLVDRQEAYEVIVAYALAPFVSRDMY